MFFQTPFPEIIFRGTLRRSRRRRAIVDGFWVPAGLQNGHGSTIFDQKGFQNLRPNPARLVLEPILERFGAENAPRTHFHQFWCSVWLILEGFWTNWEGFSKTFHDLLIAFWLHSDIVFSYILSKNLKPQIHNTTIQRTQTQRKPKNELVINETINTISQATSPKTY